MSDVLVQHLNAIAASAELLKAQIAAAKYAIGAAPPAPSQIPLEARCAGVADERCALRDEDAKKQLMGGVAVCVGCHERLASPDLT